MEIYYNQNTSMIIKPLQSMKNRLRIKPNSTNNNKIKRKIIKVDHQVKVLQEE